VHQQQYESLKQLGENQHLFKSPTNEPQAEADGGDLALAHRLKDLEKVMERLRVSGKEISDELVRKTDRLIERVIYFP
jgi:hypothetical protein